MTLPADDKSRDESPSSELQRLFKTMERLVYDGLHHGYFEFSIRGSVGKKLRRELIIEAGMNHKFTVEMDELNR